MLAVVVSIFGGFGFLIWSSYRKARTLQSEGAPLVPAGRIRWERDDG